MRSEKKSSYREDGFTLVEMMVTLAIMSIVTVAVFAVLQNSLTTSGIQNAQVDLVQNARDAVDRVSDAVEEAAYIYPFGATSSITLSGTPNDWNKNANNYLVMLMSVSTRLSATAAINQSTLSVLDSSLFAVNNTIRIGSDSYTITSVGAGSITVSGTLARNYDIGDVVFNTSLYEVRAYIIQPRSDYNLLPSYPRNATSWVLVEYRSSGMAGTVTWNGQGTPANPTGQGAANVLADYYSTSQTLLDASGTTYKSGKVNGVAVRIQTSKFVGSSPTAQSYSLNTYVHSNNI